MPIFLQDHLLIMSETGLVFSIQNFEETLTLLIVPWYLFKICFIFQSGFLYLLLCEICDSGLFSVVFMQFWCVFQVIKRIRVCLSILQIERIRVDFCKLGILSPLSPCLVPKFHIYQLQCYTSWALFLLLHYITILRYDRFHLDTSAL